jgi:hypothetical protein
MSNDVAIYTPATLARFDEAKKLVAQAKTVEDIMKVKDFSELMHSTALFCKDHVMEVNAQELRVRVTRKIGEIMEAQKKLFGLAKGAVVPGTTRGKNTPRDSIPSLPAVGVDKNLAKSARKAAAIEPDKFEKQVKNWREEDAVKVKEAEMKDKPPPKVKPIKLEGKKKPKSKKTGTATKGAKGKTTKRQRHSIGISVNKMMAEEYPEGCDTKELQWQFSASNNLASLAALSAYWDRLFGKQWRQYSRPSELLILANDADKAWPVLLDSIRRQEK